MPYDYHFGAKNTAEYITHELLAGDLRKITRKFNDNDIVEPCLSEKLDLFLLGADELKSLAGSLGVEHYPGMRMEGYEHALAAVIRGKFFKSFNNCAVPDVDAVEGACGNDRCIDDRGLLKTPENSHYPAGCWFSLTK